MTDRPKMIRISTAAAERGVTRWAVSVAIRAGHLTRDEIDGKAFVVRDAKYEEWLKKPAGHNRFTPETARAAGSRPKKRKSPE